MSKKTTKKVLFTSHVGNFQKFNRPFQRWFRDQGWEVHYASMGEEEIADCDKQYKVSFNRNPFRISNIRAYFQLRDILYREKYSIIHAHTPVGGIITRLAARNVRKKYGTKVLYTAHGFHFYKGAPIVNWLVYFPIEKLAARVTDVVVTINKEDYDIAKKSFKTSVKYLHTGVGVDVKRFSAASKVDVRKFRESIGISEDDFVLSYPAEINRNKNQNMLIKVMGELIAEYPAVHLLLAGDDTTNGKIETLITMHGLEKNIHILGYRNDVAQLLMASTTAVSSSKREGLPVNIMEAMHAGLPIVATNCRGNRDLIVDGKNGFLIDQNSSADFVHAISLLYKDSSLRDRMSQYSKKQSQDYTHENAVHIMGKIYREVMYHA